MKFTTSKQITIILISIFLFLFLSIFRDDLVCLDETIYAWLTAHQSPMIFSIMKRFTNIGSGEMILFVALIIAVILSIKRLWMYVTFILVVTFGGMFINLLLKMTFQRGRPGEARELEVFGYSLDITSYSFPSGHTMRIVLLFLVFILLCHRFMKHGTLKVISISVLTGIPVLVAISRIMIGAHFFTDILAAIFISIVWFQLCYLLFTKKFRFDKGTGFH
ncbi:phosphatase PAP2 family protein [Virgibacillus oceani]